jgi:hypothetical protein
MCLKSIYFLEALTLGPELSVTAIQTLILVVLGFSHSHRYVVNNQTVKHIMVINDNIFIHLRVDSTA